MSEADVVISGIGANFPHSSSVQDFGKDLLDNKWLPSPTNRWKYDNTLGIEAVCGHIPHEHFDHVFYGINRRLAKHTDPVSKIGYQSSFEAILDAGMHPHAMRGSNVGVYAGCGINEFEQRSMFCLNSPKGDGYTVMGISRTMFCNRISYFFDFKGPSCAMDSSWPVAHLQLQIAGQAIREGMCDAAVVVSTNLARFPETSFHLKLLGLINGEGTTKCFDQDAAGSVRSDACVAFFLQRADQAKRCYAKVLCSSVAFTGRGSSIDLTLPDPRGPQAFLTNFYSSHSIDPKRIAYLEADGSANVIRDECELNAIDAALFRDGGRSEPLLVGSVKSNLGHTDAVSGLAGICKAVVAMETGVIPATINYRTSNAGAAGLVAGRLQVVATNTPLKLAADSVVAVNTVGLASVVGHTVLQANPRGPQPPQDPSHHLPRLLTVSGRTEDGVKEAVKKLQSLPFDTNYYRLVQDTFSANIRGYDYRSYVICPSAVSDEAPVERMVKRSVWFVYSGMGSQWSGMGAGLMSVPIFAETIERLHTVLEPRRVDLKTIITETGPGAFDNILKSFLGITACQIALTNVLTAVGLVPDGIVGHSVGELGCAYADGCLTEEQTILAAYARGVASNKATLIKGMMAAVGLGAKDVLPRLPPTIDVACRNSDSSCTLSGPAEDVRAFVEQLSSEGVFARAVNVSDIAYHSRYIQPAAPFLLQQLQEVISNPKARSDKWLTTSVPLDQRESDLAKFCSAEYQTNNLLSPVLFEEALADIPEQSLLIEIAPHGLLQAIVKRALPEPDYMHVALAQRGHAHPVHCLLSAIGRTSFAGAAPTVAALYPAVEFPVPRGTGSLATLASWQVDDATYNDMFGEIQEMPPPDLDMNSDTPHMRVNGTRLLPLSEELVLMWTTVAKKFIVPMGTLAISFREFHVGHWTPIPSEGEAILEADYMPATQLVCVSSVTDLVAHSRAGPMPADKVEPEALPAVDMDAQEAITVTREELYRDLAARGLDYASRYHTINSIRMGDRDWLVSVAHNGHWSSLLESVVQIYMLRDTDSTQDLRLPRTIQRMDVDPTKMQEHSDIQLRLHLGSGILQGDGLYVAGFSMAPIPHSLGAGAPPTELQFVPYGETKCKTLDEFLRVAVTGVLETTSLSSTSADVTFMAIPNGRRTADLSKALVVAIRAATGLQARVVELTPAGTGPPGWQGPAPLLVTGPDTMMEAACSLAVGLAGALLVWSGERLVGSKGAASVSGMAVLAEQKVGDDWLAVLRRATPLTDADAVVVQLGAKASPPAVVLSPTAAVVLVWRGLNEAAMQAALAEVDAQSYASRARVVFIADDTAPPFSLAAPLYADQLARGLRVNVLVTGGVWGCYRTLPAPKPLIPALSASCLDNVKLEFVGANPLDQGSLSGHVDYVGLEDGGVRVMGVGQWLADNLRPRLDPVMRWPVPPGWTARDAATVPYVYALVYYHLKVQARAKRGESIFVHGGTSALGQAAIRIATQLGCDPIYTTVRDARQRELLHQVFPQLEPCHVLTSVTGDAFEFRLRQLTRSKGVRLIVNTVPDTGLKACMRSLGFLGRLLHFTREDLWGARTIGMNKFLSCCSMYGCQGSELFHGSELDRAEVAAAVSEGLRAGVVQPIVGAQVYNAMSGVGNYENCTKAVIEVNSSATSANQQCDPHKCYLVVGKQASEALLVAGRLSTLGARHVLAAVGSLPSSAVIRQRQRVLRRQQGTHLHVHQVRVWDAAAAESIARAAASVAPLSTAVVIAKDAVDTGVPAALCAALSPLSDVGVVLLVDRAQLAGQLDALVSQRNAQGRRTTCMAAPLAEAVSHLADLLSGATSAVTVLPSGAASDGAEIELGAVIPRSPAALCELGRDASRCANGPSVLELPTLTSPARYHRENRPLLALPPLGVLDSRTREQLAGLAARLYSPVLVVEATAEGGVSSMAKAVVKAIVTRQPFGPYNIMGWHLSTVLALEVQRQLEASGKLGKLFLVHGDVGAVRRWAAEAECPSLQRASDGLARPEAEAEAQRGAEVVAGLLDAIANHQSDVGRPFAWDVHIIRTSVDDPLSIDENGSRIHLRTLTADTVHCSTLATYVNENSAYLQLAGQHDLQASILSACRTECHKA